MILANFSVEILATWGIFSSPGDSKLTPDGLGLKSPGLENIPQVPGNRAELGQNHDARKAVSATLSVLK